MRFVFVFIILTISLFALGQQVDTTSKFIEEKYIPNGDEIYESFACDERASFPGGDAELMKYIEENVKHPTVVSECGIEGTVYIRFVITKTGEIGRVNVMRSVDPLNEVEAIRVVKSLPKWNPAIKGGNPVNTWFIVPVKFILQ